MEVIINTQVSTLLTANVTIIFPPHLISTFILRYFCIVYVDSSVLQFPPFPPNKTMQLNFAPYCSPYIDICLRSFILFVPIMIHSVACMVLDIEFYESFIILTFSFHPDHSFLLFLPWGASTLTNQHLRIVDTSVKWLRQVISGIAHP